MCSFPLSLISVFGNYTSSNNKSNYKINLELSLNFLLCKLSLQNANFARLKFNIFSILSFLLMKINNSNIRIDWFKLLNIVFQFLFYLENVFNNIQFHSFSGCILLLCKYFFFNYYSIWIFKHGYRTVQIIFNKRIITSTCLKNVYSDILVFSQSKRS